MTDLGPNERRLLRALRAADEPSDDDRARVRARVLLKVAAASGVASALATTAANAPGAAAAAGTAAGGASVAPGAAATASTLAGFAAGSWKIGAAIVTVVGAVGGAAWIASPKADPPPHTAPQSTGHQPQAPAKAAPSEANREIPESDDSESAVPSSAARSSRSRSRSPDPPASADSKADEFDSELALLTDAQRALKQGDSERALEALDQHKSEHPDGALARERAGIRAVALCESGKSAEGKREARRFLSRNPKSPLAGRVRAACLGAKK